MCYLNRRIRNRTYGGVGGRRGWPRLLPDFGEGAKGLRRSQLRKPLSL